MNGPTVNQHKKSKLRKWYIMKSGILVQHGHSPIKKSGDVRSDILAIIGFISEDLWPEDVRRYDVTGQERNEEDISHFETELGDFVELLLFKERDLYVHPFFSCIDGATTKGVQNFFANGGKQVQCLEFAYNRLSNCLHRLISKVSWVGCLIIFELMKK